MNPDQPISPNLDDLVKDLDEFLKIVPGDPADNKQMVDLLKKKGLSLEQIKAFFAGK